MTFKLHSRSHYGNKLMPNSAHFDTIVIMASCNITEPQFNCYKSMCNKNYIQRINICTHRTAVEENLYRT